MTDFKNLAQLSSDALLVVARGCIAYANPAANALMAPAAGAQGLHGLAVPAVWLPDPLQGAWARNDPPTPVTVQLRAGHAPVPGIALELIATRDQTPEGPVFYVKARHLQADGDMLAERVRTALAVSTDAAMVVDAQTLAFLDANPAACALMGLTLEAVRRRGPTTMRRRDGSGQEDFHALYAQLIEHSPQALTHEYDFLAEDGRTIPIAATRQALNVDGRWLIYITWRDISAQVSAQALVQQFKDSFDQAPDATNIIDVKTLSYVYVNEPFIKLMGLPRERVLAGGPQSMPKEIVVVDDLAAFLASVVAQHPHTLVREKTVTLPDGRRATFESHHQAVFSGGRWLVRATRVDITQRKEQQRHLQLILAAFDASSDAIYIIDPKTFAYVEVNEAAALLHGLSRDELRSLGVRGAFPDRFDDASLRARYDELIARYPQASTEDRQIPRADGKVVWAESIRRAIRVDDEWRVISVMRDITARKEAQLQLELLLAAMDSAPDAIAILDPQTFQYVHVNDAVCRLHGLTREQVMTLGMLGMFRHFTPESLRRRYDELIAMAPQAISDERTVRRSDGSEVVTEAVRRAVRVGERWLVISVSRDISERKAAQERIERFAAIVNLSSDAVLVHDPQRMALIDVNEAACRLYGYSRVQLLALPPTMNRPDQTLDDMRRVYEATIAAAPRALRAEFTTQRSDGSTFPAEAYRQAIPSSDGWLVVVTVRDQTERLAAQARIERFAAIVNLSADALFVVDRESMNVIDVNESTTRMYGYTREALLGKPVHALTVTYRDEAQRMAAEYDAVIAQSPQVSVVEVVPQRADGSTFHAEVQRMAIQSEDRWLMVITVRDISERKAAQARLELMHQAINAAPDAIVVIDPLTLEYVDVNEATAQLYGLTREQLLARGARKGLGGKSTDDEMRQFYAPIVAQAPNASVEERATHLNGRDVTLEFTRRAVNVDGRWLIVSVNRDITERKAAQARQELLTAAIEAAPDGIAVVDPDTLQYLHVNDAVCRTHAASREQLMSLGVDGMFRGQFAPDAIRAMYQAVIDSYPGTTSEERAIVALDGSTAYYEAVRRAVQVDGRWLIVSMNRDVTERKTAQARLERFAAVLNLGADAVMLVDRASMRIIDVNEAACRMHGYSRAELLALPPHQSRKGTTLQQLEADYDEAIRQSPVVVHAELDGLRADGSAFVAEVQRQALRQADGGWIIAITVRDITERKKAAARLNRLRAAIDFAPDAIYLIDPVALEYVDMNQSAGRVYGMTRDDVAALGMQRFLAHLGRMPGPQALQDMRARYADLIANHPHVDVQERLVHLPGRAPLYTETLRRAVQIDGQWLILSVLRDVTQRKLAEEETRKRVAELELLREAYDAAVDAILIADPETLGYYDVNHAAVKLLGVSREELLARGVEASYYSTSGEPFDAERFRKGSRYVISRAPEVLVEVRTVNPLGLGGRDTVIEFSRRAVNIDNRWVIVTLMRDITAAHRAEEEIRQRVAELTRSNQELEQFAYVTSHDLSEPLRMVASYTQLLSRRYADKFDDDGREFIKYAVDGAQRMKQLIDDLLMYSRAGRSKAAMRHIRLDRALDDALANLANAIERNGATIERGPLPELVCEKAGLTQVFQNLVGNAIKFRGEVAPVVRISAVQDEHFWTISVADNGIGIAPEYFQRIFVIFQRLHARTKYEGTGIGLSICKKIVERHGGQITVTSGPGQGTTFSFTLSRSLTESESP
jgi:PAS domain S-box-containing protein